MLSSAEKGDGLRRRVNSARLAVAAPAVRLAFGMRRAIRRQQPGLRRRLMAAVAVVAVLSFGTGVTLAIARTPPPGPIASGPANAAQAAAVNRAAAAAWIAGQLDPGITVSCDPQMCAQVRKAGLPAARLMTVPLSGGTASPPGTASPAGTGSAAGTASPAGTASSAGTAPAARAAPSSRVVLGSGVVVATPAVRDQIGSRLAAVDAPLVIASFGSGASRVDIRAVAAYGAAALRVSLAAGHARLSSAGTELLANKNIQASPAARASLLAGQVDPRLLVTLSALAADMPVRLVTFDDSSPGASQDVPLRGADFGAATPAGLSAALAFLRAQQPPYRPAGTAIIRSTSGQLLVTVRFDAQGVPDVGGI